MTEVVWTPELLFFCSFMLSAFTSLCVELNSDDKRSFLQILAATGLYGMVGAAFGGVVGEYIGVKSNPMKIFLCGILVGARAISPDTIKDLVGKVLGYRVDDRNERRHNRKPKDESRNTPSGNDALSSSESSDTSHDDKKVDR